MKTNELKKGDRVRLRNGWEAEIMDNLKGTRRLAKVFGFETEIGSIYAHDIVEVRVVDKETMKWAEIWAPIEHTDAQKKLRQDVYTYFGEPS